jgi:hypothetical protein
MLNDVKQLSSDNYVSGSSYDEVVTVVSVMAVVMESIVVRGDMERRVNTEECQKRAHDTQNNVMTSEL